MVPNITVQMFVSWMMDHHSHSHHPSHLHSSHRRTWGSPPASLSACRQSASAKPSATSACTCCSCCFRLAEEPDELACQFAHSRCALDGQGKGEGVVSVVRYR